MAEVMRPQGTPGAVGVRHVVEAAPVGAARWRQDDKPY